MIGVEQKRKPIIRVAGIGGGGNNAVDRMVNAGVKSIEFIALNTDSTDLDDSLAEVKIQLGEQLTNGLGAGGKPEIGAGAATESRVQIEDAIKGANLLFVTAGMGGGTGTGGAPIVAEVARKLGILTIGVVTKPFNFEGPRRMKNALAGIEALRKNVDTLVVIPNQKLMAITDKNDDIVAAFKKADDVLYQGITGITDIMLESGLIHVDFADIESVMKDKGIAHLGLGRASGKNKIQKALDLAIENPLLETNINGATDLIINFTGSDLNLHDIDTAVTGVKNAAHFDCQIIVGAIVKENAGEEVAVTFIATGLTESNVQTTEYKPPAPPPTPPKEDDRFKPVPKKPFLDEEPKIDDAVFATGEAKELIKTEPIKSEPAKPEPPKPEPPEAIAKPDSAVKPDTVPKPDAESKSILTNNTPKNFLKDFMRSENKRTEPTDPFNREKVKRVSLR